ncbi:MAG: hypothetical protein IJI35_09105, partial [Kiritimatiellae bacterium]|nr:hypothetical protein [Kiritimatiellia bacterium]
MIRRSTVSFIALLSFAASAAGGEVVLAERGRAADCAIVLPADASPSQMTAADELRDHVEKMTGV